MKTKKNKKKDSLTYEMEVLDFANDEVMEDRNGDECKVSD